MPDIASRPMTLRIHNTLTRALQPFETIEPDHVRMYVCGITVYDLCHVGHARMMIAFDLIYRWLRTLGYRVTYVRNVTDIDDKILTKAAEAGRPWWAWAYTHEQAFTAAYDAVGVRRPTYEPRATGHVPEMVELMELLVERGHAYAAPDGSGDV